MPMPLQKQPYQLPNAASPSHTRQPRWCGALYQTELGLFVLWDDPSAHCAQLNLLIMHNIRTSNSALRLRAHIYSSSQVLNSRINASVLSGHNIIG
jgi:CRISPR/Cas system-associated protein Csm6